MKNSSAVKAAKNGKPKRIIYYDILNIIACFCVVLLHHNGIVHDFSNDVFMQVGQEVWTQSLVVEVLAFFAVPIFLMLTGATLMEYRKRYDTKTFFKKRLSRVLIPFVVWMVIFFLYDISEGIYDLFAMSIQDVVEVFMFNKMMGVFWFFPAIVSIYLAIPILSLLTQPKNRKWLWYIAIVGGVLCGVIPAICGMLGIEWNGAYNLPIVGGSGLLIYPILGYLLSTSKKIENKWIIVLVVASILCVVLRFVIMHFNTISAGATDTSLSSYVYFTAVIPAVAIFLLAKKIPWDNFIKGKAVNAISKISACSLGIYLIHIFVMDQWQMLVGWEDTRLIWRTLGAVITYVICLLIVMVIKSGVISRRLFP